MSRIGRAVPTPCPASRVRRARILSASPGVRAAAGAVLLAMLSAACGDGSPVAPASESPAARATHAPGSATHTRVAIAGRVSGNVPFDHTITVRATVGGSPAALSGEGIATPSAQTAPGCACGFELAGEVSDGEVVLAGAVTRSNVPRVIPLGTPVALRANASTGDIEVTFTPASGPLQGIPILFVGSGVVEVAH